MVDVFGTVQIDRAERPAMSSATTRSIIWKYSKRMRGASGAFRRDQLIDFPAQIIEHEVLVGRRLTVIDLLRPLLKRKLDAVRLVDGKGNIEEIEAVDFKVVDRVAFRLDIITRNVASFRNDISDFIESGRHQAFQARSLRAPPVVAARIAKDIAKFNALSPRAFLPFLPHSGRLLSGAKSLSESTDRSRHGSTSMSHFARKYAHSGLAGVCAFAAAYLVAASAGAADYDVGPIHISQPWARATPKGASSAAAYMMLTNNGKTPDRVSCVSSDASAECQIHSMTMDNGVMVMRPVEGGLEIKPGETVTLKPGGFHMMLLNLKHPLEQGNSLQATLKFDSAGTVQVDYPIAGIGAAAPGMPAGGGSMMQGGGMMGPGGGAMAPMNKP